MNPVYFNKLYIPKSGVACQKAGSGIHFINEGAYYNNKMVLLYISTPSLVVLPTIGLFYLLSPPYAVEPLSIILAILLIAIVINITIYLTYVRHLDSPVSIFVKAGGKLEVVGGVGAWRRGLFELDQCSVEVFRQMRRGVVLEDSPIAVLLKNKSIYIASVAVCRESDLHEVIDLIEMNLGIRFSTIFSTVKVNEFGVGHV